MSEESKTGWFGRLKAGLSRSSSRLTQGIGDLFTKRKLDQEALEELEELLISADFGVATASKVTGLLAKTRLDHILCATALNLIRLDAYWNGHPLDRARTSHLTRLQLTLTA